MKLKLGRLEEISQKFPPKRKFHAKPARCLCGPGPSRPPLFSSGSSPAPCLTAGNSQTSGTPQKSILSYCSCLPKHEYIYIINKKSGKNNVQKSVCPTFSWNAFLGPSWEDPCLSACRGFQQSYRFSPHCVPSAPQSKTDLAR